MWIVTSHGEKRAGTLFRVDPLVLLVMPVVMCVVTNHEGKQGDRLFRVDSVLLFVMADVIFQCMSQGGRWCPRGTRVIDPPALCL